MIAKCPCDHCVKNIEFTTEEFPLGSKVACPHCQRETVLFAPEQKSVPPIIEAPKRKRLLIFTSLGLVLCGLGFAAILMTRPQNWIKTGTAQDGNLVITVRRMYLSADFVHNEAGVGAIPTEQHLHILVCVSNISDNLKSELDSWGNGDARLTDNSGNNYGWIDFGDNRPEYLKSHFTIYPHQVVMDNLVFQQPILNSKWFHLELMGHNYGGMGELRFEVPCQVYGSAF